MTDGQRRGVFDVDEDRALAARGWRGAAPTTSASSARSGSPPAATAAAPLAAIPLTR
jgi:hypothetical protein